MTIYNQMLTWVIPHRLQAAGLISTSGQAAGRGRRSRTRQNRGGGQSGHSRPRLSRGRRPQSQGRAASS